MSQSHHQKPKLYRKKFLPSGWVRLFLWRELNDFTFVHFLGFLYSDPDGSSAVLHQDFRLLHFRRVHLRKSKFLK